MGEKTNIQWADATFNPWVGCTSVSPGCDNCYAKRFGKRLGVEWGPNAERRRTSAATWKQPLRWKWKAKLALESWEWDNREGLGWGHEKLKPRRPRVFCGSLCDVFDNAVPQLWRTALFGLIYDTLHLDWLLLTKRIGNAATMLREDAPEGIDMGALPNVWIGATVCNQEEADRGVKKLLATPAAKRFLSIEPMLERVYLNLHNEHRRRLIGARPGIDWVICGGESGPLARPMSHDWVRGLRDQCESAGVPFFFKSWGAWNPNCVCDTKHPHQTTPRPEPGGPGVMFRCGPKAPDARLLDGREWNEAPA